MDKILNLNIILSDLLNIKDNRILMFLYTLGIIILIKTGVDFLVYSYKKLSHNEKNIYNFSKNLNVVKTVFTIIAVFFIWESYIRDFMTLISFLSTAFVFAIRDIVFNFFSGIYIKTFKPFVLEDRIKIQDIEGDVININYLNFEILEVNEKEKGEQSTGIIIHIPSSKIFTEPLKNYTKVFKYIWNELEIKVPIDSDIKKTKSLILKVVRTNDVIRKIPQKMEEQINYSSDSYRIYYNNLEPIIYTKVEEECVVLTVRYLVHPKKARNIESDIWNQLLLLHKEEKIILYSK